MTSVGAIKIFISCFFIAYCSGESVTKNEFASADALQSALERAGVTCEVIQEDVRYDDEITGKINYDATVCALDESNQEKWVSLIVFGDSDSQDEWVRLGHEIACDKNTVVLGPDLFAVADEGWIIEGLWADSASAVTNAIGGIKSKVTCK